MDEDIKKITDKIAVLSKEKASDARSYDIKILEKNKEKLEKRKRDGVSVKNDEGKRKHDEHERLREEKEKK